MNTQILVLIAVAAFVGKAVCVSPTCYGCESAKHENPACEDPLDKTSPKVNVFKCTADRMVSILNNNEELSGMKGTDDAYACAKFAFSIDGYDVIERGCGLKSVQGTPFCTYMKEAVTSNNGTFKSCSVCETDLCNG